MVAFLLPPTPTTSHKSNITSETDGGLKAWGCERCAGSQSRELYACSEGCCTLVALQSSAGPNSRSGSGWLSSPLKFKNRLKACVWHFIEVCLQVYKSMRLQTCSCTGLCVNCAAFCVHTVVSQVTWLDHNNLYMVAGRQ